MSLCAMCGMELAGDAYLCSYHHDYAGADDWAAGNRLMCDLLHRRVPPPGAKAAGSDRKFVSRRAEAA